MVLLSSLFVGLLALAPAMESADLASRVGRVVQVVDARWVLVGTAGSDDDCVHRWRRINDTMTFHARQFETPQDALAHIKELVATLSVDVEEKLKLGSYAVRIEWGDRSSTIYMTTGRTAVIINAPDAELARRLSRQAVIEFAERPALSTRVR